VKLWSFALTFALLACGSGCEESPPDVSPTPEADSAEPAATSADEVSEPTRLGVSPREIARARQEAAGLYRMPLALRAQTLARRREQPAPSYAELRAGADAHATERASFEGHVAFVRSAGPRLWILPLHTRRVGPEQWADPIYVLSTIPPMLPVDGGSTARIDGWIVGDRTIGQNTLPLMLAYYVEQLDAPAEEAQ